MGKLVRANKFTLDTVLYKVGEDAISDAFSRAADASDSAQVVLIFPTLQEEMQNSNEEGSGGGKQKVAAHHDQGAQKKKEDDERDKLKTEWLNLLFTDQSVAATSPEGPLPTTLEAGNKRNPSSLIVWMGDDPSAENKFIKNLGGVLGSSALISVSWSQHPAGEGLVDFNLSSPEVTDGSWYQRERKTFENEDLDMLHDYELLGRSMIETVEPKLGEYGLDWSNVILAGFGKGAGIALYASLLKVISRQVAGIVLYNAVVPFPVFLAEKIGALKRGSQNLKALRKANEVQCTQDTLADGTSSFD